MKSAACALVFCAAALAAEPKVGDPAPPMILAQTLQAPAGAKADWAGLKGNAVVLEFWATWCPGCRDQIDHLNRLEAQFQGKAIRFISVTDEEPEVVERFLKDYHMSGWIGIDAGGRTFRNFHIEGRPQTALVDANGILRGVGNPGDLTGELVDNFLAGKPIVFTASRMMPATKLEALPQPLFQRMIRPAGPVAVTGFSPGAMSGEPGRRLEIWGVSLVRLLAEAYGMPESRIAGPEWASQDKYDIALADPELTTELFQRTLADAFQLKLHKDSRDTAGYVLQPRAGVVPKLRPAASGATSHWGKPGDITAVSVSLAGLTASAENALHKPVFDETRLQGRFDFELKWTPGDAASFMEAVREQLGLDLIPAQRPLEYLVVDSAVRPKAW